MAALNGLHGGVRASLCALSRYRLDANEEKDGTGGVDAVTIGCDRFEPGTVTDDRGDRVAPIARVVDGCESLFLLCGVRRDAACGSRALDCTAGLSYMWWERGDRAAPTANARAP